MLQTRSRLLTAAAVVAILGTFGAAPALAAGMTGSEGGMANSQQHMSGGKMATHEGANTQHGKTNANQTAGGAMANEGGMK